MTTAIVVLFFRINVDEFWPIFVVAKYSNFVRGYERLLFLSWIELFINEAREAKTSKDVKIIAKITIDRYKSRELREDLYQLLRS